LRRASKRRGKAKADRFEQESVEFHEKLRRAYRHIALSEPNRCVLIGTEEGEEAVAEKIWEIVSKRLDPMPAAVITEDVVR
jgi:dTMP kinase